MPNISPELVNRYIEGAKPFAESEAELLAIELAAEWNSPAPKYRGERGSIGKYIPEMKFAADKAAEEVLSWRNSILQEIHAALCKGSTRYKKYVGQVRDNANLLIGGIAVYIAGEIGVAVAVVAALVASLLRMVFLMGLSVFCKRFKAGLL